MSWFYAEAGVQKGPIDNDTFADLVRSGVVRPTTLVWREGMNDWQAYGEVVPSATVPSGASPAIPLAAPAGAATTTTTATAASGNLAPDAAACVECGGVFPRSDMVAYANRHVCPGCRDRFFQKVREGAYAPGQVGDAPLEYAGFGIRWGAKIIDGIVITAIQVVLVLPLMFLIMSRVGAQGEQSAEAMLWVMGLQLVMSLAQFVIVILFKGIFYGRWGATPGKMALGLKVVRPDGGALRTGRAFARAAAEILNGFTLYIGYLIAAFDEERRGLHDRICDTRVIRVR